MAISVNWASKIITVPQADLTFISGVLYELDVNTFRLALKALEDDADGMVFDDTHRHTPPTTLSGVTYARFIEIINGYTVVIQDGQYVVRCVGANHNLADVKVANQVSLIIGNAAGLVVTGSGVTAQDKLDIADRVWDEAASEHVGVGSLSAEVQSAAVPGDAMTLTAGARLAVITELLAEQIEASVSMKQILRAVAAALAGNASGGPGNSVFQAVGNPGTARVASTATPAGDRTVVLTL
jgi:hypothetical protein